MTIVAKRVISIRQRDNAGMISFYLRRINVDILKYCRQCIIWMFEWIIAKENWLRCFKKVYLWIPNDRLCTTRNVLFIWKYWIRIRQYITDRMYLHLVTIYCDMLVATPTYLIFTAYGPVPRVMIYYMFTEEAYFILAMICSFTIIRK